MNIDNVTISDAIPPAFVLRLARIGKVRLFSNQVSIESTEGLDFSKVEFPPNCKVEWASAEATSYSYKQIVKLTFRFAEPSSPPA